MSLVQKELVAADVSNAFGHFVKFIVTEDEPAAVRATTGVVKSALEVMMPGQRNVCKPSLPEAIGEKTLFNDLLRRRD